MFPLSHKKKNPKLKLRSKNANVFNMLEAINHDHQNKIDQEAPDVIYIETCV